MAAKEVLAGPVGCFYSSEEKINFAGPLKKTFEKIIYKEGSHCTCYLQPDGCDAILCGTGSAGHFS